MSSAVEVYGFVGWVTSLLGFLLYLSWALIPNEILESVGITYYPDKHWALTIPLLLSLATVYVFTGYEFLNMMMVQTPQDLTTVRDSTPVWTEEEVILKFTLKYNVSQVITAWNETGTKIPPLKDIPVGFISRQLYGNKET